MCVVLADDWYVLDSEPNSFVLVVYRGSNDAWDGYGGGTLYTKVRFVTSKHLSSFLLWSDGVSGGSHASHVPRVVVDVQVWLIWRSCLVRTALYLSGHEFWLAIFASDYVTYLNPGVHVRAYMQGCLQPRSDGLMTLKM